MNLQTVIGCVGGVGGVGSDFKLLPRLRIEQQDRLLQRLQPTNGRRPIAVAKRLFNLHRRGRRELFFQAPQLRQIVSMRLTPSAQYRWLALV